MSRKKTFVNDVLEQVSSEDVSMYTVRVIESHGFSGSGDVEQAWREAERRLAADARHRPDLSLDAAVEQLGRAAILSRPPADWRGCVERICALGVALFSGRGEGRTAPAWMQAYAAARILRDRPAALALSKGLLDPFPGEGEAYDGHRAEIARALCVWELGGDWSEPLHNAYFKVMTPTVSARHATSVGWPLLDMLLALHRRRPDAFNEALYAVLAGHRELCEVEGGGWRPSSLVALVPLGLCCLASDQGIPIDVESPYIPAWLIEGG